MIRSDCISAPTQQQAMGAFKIMQSHASANESYEIKNVVEDPNGGWIIYYIVSSPDNDWVPSVSRKVEYSNEPSFNEPRYTGPYAYYNKMPYSEIINNYGEENVEEKQKERLLIYYSILLEYIEANGNHELPNDLWKLIANIPRERLEADKKSLDPEKDAFTIQYIDKVLLAKDIYSKIIDDVGKKIKEQNDQANCAGAYERFLNWKKE